MVWPHQANKNHRVRYDSIIYYLVYYDTQREGVTYMVMGRHYTAIKLLQVISFKGACMTDTPQPMCIEKVKTNRLRRVRPPFQPHPAPSLHATNYKISLLHEHFFTRFHSRVCSFQKCYTGGPMLESHHCQRHRWQGKSRCHLWQ